MARTIKSMADEDLLSEYASLQRWAGDDFAINPISRKEIARGYKLAAEILRRMRRA
jgi:hypothetical protein